MTTDGAGEPRDLDSVFSGLRRSRFRSRFRLRGPELEYLRAKGLPTVMGHAEDFVDQRLAPAEPAGDGSQTPFRNHPVFVAQHATATCCRGCLSRWHGIAKGRELGDVERAHVLAAIERWLSEQEAGRA